MDGDETEFKQALTVELFGHAYDIDPGGGGSVSDAVGNEAGVKNEGRGVETPGPAGGSEYKQVWVINTNEQGNLAANYIQGERKDRTGFWKKEISAYHIQKGKLARFALNDVFAKFPTAQKDDFLAEVSIRRKSPEFAAFPIAKDLSMEGNGNGGEDPKPLKVFSDDKEAEYVIDEEGHHCARFRVSESLEFNVMFLVNSTDGIGKKKKKAKECGLWIRAWNMHTFIGQYVIPVQIVEALRNIPTEAEPSTSSGLRRNEEEVRGSRKRSIRQTSSAMVDPNNPSITTFKIEETQSGLIGDDDFVAQAKRLKIYSLEDVKKNVPEHLFNAMVSIMRSVSPEEEGHEDGDGGDGEGVETLTIQIPD